MSTKLEAALDAVRRGFSVFPIHAYVDPGPNATKEQRDAAAKLAKAPLVKHWQDLASQDPKQIEAWWAEWPDANLATPTNTLVVPDIDPRNGGKPTFEMLALIENWPKTAVSNTQGGGNHIFYAAPDGRPVKGGNHKLGQGIDIKARGGYVLLPGSTIEGRAYTWANENPIAGAPQWILDKCAAARSKTESAGKRIVEEDETALALATQWMLDRAPTAEYGEIDDTTYKVAARLYDFGCSQDTVRELVTEWNEIKCNPPGDTERLEVVVESAGRNRENAIGSKHPQAPGFEAVEIDESKAPQAETGITASKPVDGMKLERFFAAADKALTTQAEPLIKGVLDRNAMSILYGESNTGKTFLAVDMAFHIAANLVWAKCKVRPGAVVYVAAEGGAGVYKRLAALRKHYKDVGDIPLFVVKFPVDLLHSKEHVAELVKLCRAAAAEAGCDLELIVIDTLSRAMSGGDENSSTDMGAMVKSFDAIREATAAHLMVIHHSGKDRARGARGHSLLRAATDTEIEIERGKLTVTKQRDMEGDFTRAFHLQTVTIGTDADGEPVTSCVVDMGKTYVAGEAPLALSLAETRVLNVINKMVGDDKETVFGWEDIVDFMSEISTRHVSDKGAKRPTIVGHLKAISDKGYIRKIKDNQYVMA